MQKLKEELSIAGSKAQYDEHAKSLLALKEVLAQILVGVTEEFFIMQGRYPRSWIVILRYRIMEISRKFILFGSV